MRFFVVCAVGRGLVPAFDVLVSRALHSRFAPIPVVCCSCGSSPPCLAFLKKQGRVDCYPQGKLRQGKAG